MVCWRPLCIPIVVVVAAAASWTEINLELPGVRDASAPWPLLRKTSAIPNVHGDTMLDSRTGGNRLHNSDGVAVTVNSLSMNSLPLPAEHVKYSNASIYGGITDIGIGMLS